MRRLVLKRKSRKAVQRRHLITKQHTASPISEQYRTIRTNIQFSTVDEQLRTLMVTSSSPGEGKTTTATNLAVIFAQEGKKVLLVDTDMRRPTVHYTFSLANTYGLTSVLTKQIELADAVQTSDVENLSILTSGPIPPNPAELLNTKAMDEFFQTAKDEFDLVLFDSPPVLAVTDAQILANKCDGTILVVSSGSTEEEQALKAKELLVSAKGKILGVVLNKRKMKRTDAYSYYYGLN